MVEISIVNNRVIIPKDGKKTFTPNINLTKSEIESCFLFSSKMVYGDGFHQHNAFGGNEYRRSDLEIFRNTFMGKVAENALYKYLTQNKIAVDQAPNYEVWGQNIWEDTDFTLENGNIRLSVKSCKDFANLLLLEIGRYNTEGLYIEPAEGCNPVLHDFIFLCRVRGADQIEVSTDLAHIRIQSEVTGFITHDKFKQLIAGSRIIRKGALLGTPLIVDNYYICANDLENPDLLIKYLIK